MRIVTKNQPKSTIANSSRINSSHRAFVLLDAIMGIFVCALGLALAFRFLSLQNPPQISSYMSYKKVLLSPNITQIQLPTHSAPTLTYQGEIYRDTQTNLSFFVPTHIR